MLLFTFHLILRSHDLCVGWRSYGFAAVFVVTAFSIFRGSIALWREAQDWEDPRGLTVLMFLCAMICVVSACEILMQNCKLTVLLPEQAEENPSCLGRVDRWKLYRDLDMPGDEIHLRSEDGHYDRQNASYQLAAITRQRMGEGS